MIFLVLLRQEISYSRILTEPELIQHNSAFYVNFFNARSISKKKFFQKNNLLENDAPFFLTSENFKS